jgi:hypothetical protein
MRQQSRDSEVQYAISFFFDSVREEQQCNLTTTETVAEYNKAQEDIRRLEKRLASVRKFFLSEQHQALLQSEPEVAVKQFFAQNNFDTPFTKAEVLTGFLGIKHDELLLFLIDNLASYKMRIRLMERDLLHLIPGVNFSEQDKKTNTEAAPEEKTNKEAARWRSIHHEVKTLEKAIAVKSVLEQVKVLDKWWAQTIEDCYTCPLLGRRSLESSRELLTWFKKKILLTQNELISDGPEVVCREIKQEIQEFFNLFRELLTNEAFFVYMASPVTEADRQILVKLEEDFMSTIQLVEESCRERIQAYSSQILSLRDKLIRQISEFDQSNEEYVEQEVRQEFLDQLGVLVTQWHTQWNQGQLDALMHHNWSIAGTHLLFNEVRRQLKRPITKSSLWKVMHAIEQHPVSSSSQLSTPLPGSCAF